MTTIATRLGAQPFTIPPDDLPDGAPARAALKTFCSRAGISWKEVKFFSMTTLRNAYCDRDTFANLAKIDRDAAGERATGIANAAYQPRREDEQAPAPRPMPGPLGAASRTEPTAAPIAAPTPIAVPIMANNAAAKLQEALAAIAQGITTPLDEAAVIALIHQHAPRPEPKGIRIEIGAAPAVTIDDAHAMLPRVLTWLASGAHVALVGPAGTGKTELARQAATALGVRFYLSGALDSPYRLMGFTDAQGRYVRTAFRDAFEHGGLFLLDEADASSAGALLALNSALANGHCDFPDAQVTVHPAFVCMIAANTYGRGADRQYVGRNQLDAATLDRFAMLEIDYDAKLERALTGNDAWVNRVQSLRAKARAVKARLVISMRASIRGARALAAGIPQNDVEDAVVWKGIDADTRAKIEAA